MNILVTGGGGYIGNVLVESLLMQSFNVTVYDNFRFNQTPLLHLLHYRNLSIETGDVRHYDSIAHHLRQADCIIHLAAIVGAPSCDEEPYDAITTNFESTKMISNNLSKDQILIYPCTNSGYGIGTEGLYCDESHPLRPISLYGKTKVQGEDAVMERENSISFRLATVFGASVCMRTELLINDFVLRAIRDKSIVLFESHFKRNYIHVRDVAKAFCLGIKKFDQMKSNVFNVGLSDANLSKKDLCCEIQKYIDFIVIEEQFRKDSDQRNYLVSNAKIESYGFKPDYSIADGVDELIKTYKITGVSYHQR